MQTTAQSTGSTINISREKLVSFASQMFGGASSGNPNPDEPLKPGPWDPVIRKALERIRMFGPQLEPWGSAFGPSPEPWLSESNAIRSILEFFAARHPEIWDAIGGGQVFNRAAIEFNHQSLHPRAAFAIAFAQEAVDRLALMQEIADLLPRQGQQQGIIIVGGRLSMLVDELCGNNFKIKIPIPHPKHDPDDRLSGLELILAGAVFEQNAAITQNTALQQEFRNAGARLIENGLDRS